MTNRLESMREARRHARAALRSARYAVGQLEGLISSLDPAQCACVVEDAKIALEDGSIDAKLALAEFHRACQH